MANGLELKTRDTGRDIDADDPLMELSRIMGFDKFTAANEPLSDPQQVIEDSFSLDLERELALEEPVDLAPADLEAEFASVFDEELSDALQVGNAAPSVVPSLEDELNMLLASPAATIISTAPPLHGATRTIEPATSSYDDADAGWIDDAAGGIDDAEVSRAEQVATHEVTAFDLSEDLADLDDAWTGELDVSAEADDLGNAVSETASLERWAGVPEISVADEAADALPVLDANWHAAADAARDDTQVVDEQPLAMAQAEVADWRVEPATELSMSEVSWDAEEFSPSAREVDDNAEIDVAPRLNPAIDERSSMTEVEPDLSWLDEIANSPAVQAHPTDITAEPQHDDNGEPWLDVDIDEQLSLIDAKSEPVEVATSAVSSGFDPILAHMSRATPTLHRQTPSVATSPTSEELEFDFALDEIDPAQPAVSDFDMSWDAEEASVASGEPVVQPQMEGLLARISPEPVVDIAEPFEDSVTPTDDFEIPDFDFSPEPKVAVAAAEPTADMADFEPQYAGYEPKIAPKAVAAETESDFDFDAILDEEFATQSAAAPIGYAAAAGAAVAATSTLRPKPAARVDADVDFQPFGDEPPAMPDYATTVVAPPRRSWLVPALLAGVAVLGGGVYYAFSGNSSATASGGPVLVKADPQPVKVAPENPGGKTVPDQDKAVYSKVDGQAGALPTQGTLVSESEEPVDIASVAPAESEPAPAPAQAAVKSEARVDTTAEPAAPAATPAETAAVSPKKVRTFVVKPDGSLVERPAAAAAPKTAEAPVAVEAAKLVPAAVKPAVDPAVATAAVPAAKSELPAEDAAVAVPAAKPVPAAKKSAATAPEADVAPAKANAPAAGDIAKLAAAEPAAAAPAADVAPVIKVVKAKKIKAPVAETAATQAVPVLEDSRPADQPVTIVGKTGGKKQATTEVAANAETQDATQTQVASAEPAPAPAAGGYAIQIASTPSPEAAKSTYAALNRKFLDVIGGRGVSIQKAAVEGKGTVYRVRIPAGSKKDAAALCAQYKASGGNCFVTK